MAALTLNGTLTSRNDIDGSISSQLLDQLIGASGALPSSIAGILVGNSPITLPVPELGVATFIMIQNTGSSSILVGWTPNGGSPATIVSLNPGGVIIVGVDSLPLVEAITVVCPTNDGSCKYTILGLYP